MVVPRNDREPMFTSKRRDPRVILRDGISSFRKFRLDLTVMNSRYLVRSNNGRHFQKSLNLLQCLHPHGPAICSSKKLSQNGQGHEKKPSGLKVI